MASFRRSVGALALLGAAAFTGACSRVTPDQMQSELARVRQEMVAGDSAVAGRVARTDQRVDVIAARLDSLQRDLQALRTEYNASIQRLETALRFNVPVHFAFDDATVRETDTPVLDRFSKVALKYFSGARITVEGFTDPAGSPAYNLALGKRRAEAVKSFLVKQGGLPADRVNAVSYGEARNRQVVPGAMGPGPEGMENRRVALVIDYAGGNTATTGTQGTE